MKKENPETELFVQILDLKYLKNLAPLTKQIVCIKDIKMAMLAQSIICPGMLTVVQNLIISVAGNEFIPKEDDGYAPYCNR